MSDEFAAEYARALWQSQESQVPTLAMDDVRARTAFLREQFRRSWLVPWVVAAFLGAFFLFMLLGVARTDVQRAGAAVGMSSGVVMAIGGLWGRKRAALASIDTGLAAYRVQLETQRTALGICALAIALMMMGSAGLAAPEPWDPLQALKNGLGPLLGGGVSVWFVLRHAGRYRRRIAEVARLERT